MAGRAGLLWACGLCAGLLGALAPARAREINPPQAVFTSTLAVEDLAADGDTLWVASRGGVEAYSLRTLARRRLYTTRDGLAENAARRVELLPVGAAAKGAELRVRTERSLCALRLPDGDRFACAPAAPLPAAAPALSPSFHGARVTRRLRVGGREFVGTAGRGVWLDGARPQALSPSGQICSNHIMAMADYGGRLWLGSFDEGLCSYDAATRRFETPDTPFRMVNALQATAAGLYIATSEGLFVTTDGRGFTRVAAVRERGINHLASDGAWLYATAPAALYQIGLLRGRRDRVLWRPGGTRALQAVAHSGGSLWLASEDRGAIRLPGAAGRVTGGPQASSSAQIFDRASGLPSSWTLAVAPAPDGGAYLATLRHGLVRVDAQGRSSEVQGLPDRWLLHVSVDAATQGLWVGTQGGAAYVSPRGEATTIPALPHPCAHALLARAGAVWVATEGGTSVHRL